MTKYDGAMLKTAKIFAEQSYAKRLKVGATLSKDGRILATSYNGTISKTSNECEIECDVCKGLDKNCKKCQGFGLVTSPYVLHAEQNLIVWAAKNGISTNGATMYITHSPCKECSKLIAQSGIVRVVYEVDYRDADGIDFLKSIGIEVDKVESK